MPQRLLALENRALLREPRVSREKSADAPSFGENRDWLLRFCPQTQVSALVALFEIEREVLFSLQHGLEHQVAHLRLEWWQEELARLADAAPRHPACRALVASALTRRATPADLRPLIEHVRVDLACVAFLNRDELDTHLANWAGSVFREAILSSPDIDNAVQRAAGERLAASAGPAVRELELLANFTLHAQAGRIYTPLGEAPDAHRRWNVSPLGADEAAVLAARQSTLFDELREAAASVLPAVRPALRTALLWMAFAIDNAQHSRNPRSALGRTLYAWRAALAISRGSMPFTLKPTDKTAN